MTNYVSAVPLKELGLGLGIEHLGDEQAQELTDDYSLPALKVNPAGLNLENPEEVVQGGGESQKDEGQACTVPQDVTVMTGQEYSELFM